MKNKKFLVPEPITYKLTRTYGIPQLAHKTKKWLIKDSYYIYCLACKTYIPIDKFCYSFEKWEGKYRERVLGIVCNKLCGEMAILQII
jgi:hypothetical protein